jgi:hypothetical protein
MDKQADKFLWTYRADKIDWLNGSPIGNGDIGAMVHGSAGRFIFSMNKSDIWENRINDKLKALYANQEFKHEAIVKLLKEKNYEKFNQFWQLTREAFSEMGHGCYPTPNFQPAGEIEITSAVNAEMFCQELNTHNASVKVDYKSDSFFSFIDAVANVAIIKMNSSENRKRTLRLYRIPNRVYASPTYQVDNRWFYFTFRFPDGLMYVVMCYLDGGDIDKIRCDEEIRLDMSSRANECCTLYVSIISNNDSKNPILQARRLIESARKKNVSVLFGEHSQWWKAFWEKSSIDLPDKMIERLWYLAIYLVGSSSRPGNQAPGLQGLWNRDNFPEWNADYHLDFNMQAIYWPIYAANHLELGEPFYRLFKNMLPEVKRLTRNYYGFDGAKFPVATNKDGVDMVTTLAYWLWPGAGAWISHHYWLHYLYSKDVDFLREIAYPVMKECAAFYQKYISKDENGTYFIYPTISPEQGGGDPGQTIGTNSTIDLAFIKHLFQALIETSKLLNVDTDKRAEWQDILDHWPAYPVRNGHLIDMEGVDWRNSHRHLSLLVPIFPIGEMTLASPEPMRKLAQSSLDDVLSRGTDGWYPFTYTWISAIAARLGRPQLAVDMLHTYSEKYIGRNGVNMNRESGKRKVLGLDSSCILAAAVNEMLIQSYDGIIRVFPAVPEEWTAKFYTLRAVGGFLISSQITRGQVLWIKIKSEISGECKIQNPWTGCQATLLDCGTKENISTEKGDILIFTAKQGHTYEITKSK